MADSIFCNFCGTKLPSNSSFCLKCGQSLIIDHLLENKKEHTLADLPIEQTENKNFERVNLISNKQIDVPSSNLKIKIIISVTIAVVAVFLIYLFNYSNAVDIAENMYYDGEYDKAEDKITSYFPLSKEDSNLFKEIKLLNACNKNMDYFEMYATSNYIEKDMKSALRSLLNGYQQCSDNEASANKYDIGYKFTSIKNNYLRKLEDYYDISIEKADQLIKLDYSARSSEIETLYSKGNAKAEQMEQESIVREMRERNPLKISELTLSSNSSYNILEGTATNVSEKTLKFVEIKGLFKDSDGNVIDTDWTYAVGSEGLAPNESKKFRMSVKNDNRIAGASVELK